MNKTNTYKNARDIMTGLCRLFPKLTDETITVRLDNGITVSVEGANRPLAGRMTVSTLSGDEILESIDYLYDTGEVVRIVLSLCRKNSTDQLLEEGLIFTADSGEWARMISVGHGSELAAEECICEYTDNEPDDDMAA